MGVRRRVHLTVAISLAAFMTVGLAGCTTPADSLAVPTDPRIGSADGDMGALQGRFGGMETGDGTACFWVDGPNGRAYLVLREGSYSTPDLELRPSGAQLSTLKIGQTYLFSGAPDRDVLPKGCPGAGTVLITGQVQPENPDYTQATLPPPKTRS